MLRPMPRDLDLVYLLYAQLSCQGYPLLRHYSTLVLQAAGSPSGPTSAPAAVFRRKSAAPKRTAPTPGSASAPAAGARRDPRRTGPTGSGRMAEADSDDSEDDVPLIKRFDSDRWVTCPKSRH